MAWEAVDGGAELVQLAADRPLLRQRGGALLECGREDGVGVERLGDGVYLVQREAQRLADIAHGGAGAIRDDLADHRCVFAAVLVVDVLDDLLAVLVGDVQVDVGEAFALFGQETLEEQVLADRVDVGDAQGVADCGVGGGAATLRHDAAFGAATRDVPHNQKVAGQSQLLDHFQLVAKLAHHRRRDRVVAAAGAFVAEAEEVAEGRLPRR